jgi:carbon-monoxide dehydrogenase medium subunit
MKLPDFDYVSPTSLGEALAALRGKEDAKLISGGQSLMPMLAFRLLAPKLLVDLRGVPELAGIRIDADGVHLGARVRWRDILDHDALAVAHPLLRSAVSHIAHYQIRNRGTVGGSLAHADPAAELPAVAVACGAMIEIAGESGKRRIPADHFFTGALGTVLGADEIVTALHLPPWPANRLWGFQEFSRRSGDFALAGVCMFCDLENGMATNAHIVVFSAGDRAVRLAEAEAALNGAPLDTDRTVEVVGIAARTAEVNGDIHAGAPYRRALVQAMAERALGQALARYPES